MSTFQKQYKIAGVIGRFQPFHKGHFSMLLQAANIAEHVIVFVGSSYESRTIKNPYTFDERKRMIEANSMISPDRMTIMPIVDSFYNESAWYNTIQFHINQLADGGKVVLVGHKKDASSFYLDHFPGYDYKEIPPVHDEDNVVHATDIRRDMFEARDENVTPFTEHDTQQRTKWLPDGVFDQLCDEYDYIKNYRAAWEFAPYPPAFICSDAIVYQSGHVLLVKRKNAPGKGLWAIPGGFVNPDETFFKAAIRELIEETRVKVCRDVLEGSMFESHVFDHPERSLRGRLISHAFGFRLKDDKPLPRVKGSDDAEKAQWIPIEMIHSHSFREKMFEDHASILEYFLNRIPANRK